MLYLMKTECKGAFPLPPDQWMEVVVKQLETLTSYKQQGKILAGGPLANGRAGYFIFDVDSNEELLNLGTQLPMFPFCDVEITALATLEHALESVKQSLVSLRASK